MALARFLVTAERGLGAPTMQFVDERAHLSSVCLEFFRLCIDGSFQCGQDIPPKTTKVPRLAHKRNSDEE
jgi:hypothetical protein